MRQRVGGSLRHEGHKDIRDGADETDRRAAREDERCQKMISCKAVREGHGGRFTQAWGGTSMFPVLGKIEKV